MDSCHINVLPSKLSVEICGDEIEFAEAVMYRTVQYRTVQFCHVQCSLV